MQQEYELAEYAKYAACFTRSTYCVTCSPRSGQSDVEKDGVGPKPIDAFESFGAGKRHRGFIAVKTEQQRHACRRIFVVVDH